MTSPTIIARTVTRTVVPIILLTAIALTLQGHNNPGGGFIGGVLTVTAFALVYITFGSNYVTSVLLSSSDISGVIGAYRTTFALGLALAAGSGIVSIAFGVPFLTQAVAFLEGVPIYGMIELPSALAFDLGVYFTVVGGLLAIISVVGEE